MVPRNRLSMLIIFVFKATIYVKAEPKPANIRTVKLMCVLYVILWIYYCLIPVEGEMCSIQHYVIKSVSDLRQVRGFLRVLRFPLPNKTDHHDIAEILLKVVLNTIKQNQTIKVIITIYTFYNESIQ